MHLLAIWWEKSRIHLHKIGQSLPAEEKGRCAVCNGGYLDTTISSDGVEGALKEL